MFDFPPPQESLTELLMFEGEPDHLIPSTSEFLLESDMFHVAG